MSAIYLVNKNYYNVGSRFCTADFGASESFEYAAKQACKQLQCNKAKLSEPASINVLHNIRRKFQHAFYGRSATYDVDALLN